MDIRGSIGVAALGVLLSGGDSVAGERPGGKAGAVGRNMGHFAHAGYKAGFSLHAFAATTLREIVHLSNGGRSFASASLTNSASIRSSSTTLM